MNIAIDFDDTLTAEPDMWRRLIFDAETRGHRVVCVTARRDTPENRECVDEWMQEHDVQLRTYYTGLRSKVEHMKSIGVPVNIWIDDDPERLVNGH